MLLTQWPPGSRYLLFTGKGGVGKTSLSCATAVHLAQTGKRVLLVSTDPASNVAQVFGRPIGARVTALGDLLDNTQGRVVLDAVEIDPQAEAALYRESVLAPVRDLLPPEVLAETEETLSGSCTVEVAAFNRFVDFLVNPDLQDAYDHIIFDTAPTGHTLRLLALPGDWSTFISNGAGDASCLGPLSGLDKHRRDYERAVAVLGDLEQTTLTLVARPEESTLAEAQRSAYELEALGVRASALVINGILPPSDGDPLHERLFAVEQSTLSHLTETYTALGKLALFGVPMSAQPVMGVEGLAAITPVKLEPGRATARANDGSQAVLDVMERSLDQLVTTIATGDPKVVLAMGKGGVGKTSVAQAVAVSLAQQGRQVLLATTDPASHLDARLSERYSNLEITSIDPARVVAEYRQQVLETKGATLDAVAHAQLKEDLASPCTEEVAVFRAFSSVLDEVEHRWVVLDTAPTGHTLLLLDATGSYHRELMRQAGVSEDVAGRITALTRLRDPNVTFSILVTLPETTPILEAQELSQDLQRAGIIPRAWVVNQYLPDNTTNSGFLHRRTEVQQNTVKTLLGQADEPISLLTVPLA